MGVFELSSKATPLDWYGIGCASGARAWQEFPNLHGNAKRLLAERAYEGVKEEFADISHDDFVKGFMACYKEPEVKR